MISCADKKRGRLRMASIDEVFFKEFNNMMQILKGTYGYVDLNDIPVPQELVSALKQSKKDMVVIGNITEKYYDNLNGSLALLWGKAPLKRRKYDYKGEFIKDKEDNFVYEDVTCPTDCLAVVSDRPIGVPTKFKPDEHFVFVDTVERNLDGVVETKFIYIVPRKYCFKVNQTALVLSWNKLRVYYSGVIMAMQNGHSLYMYIIPYKPTLNSQHNYRVLLTKPSNNYNDEIALLHRFWVKNNVIFDHTQCEMAEPVRGITNPALIQLDGVIDEYVMFNPNKSLNHDDSIMDEEDFTKIELEE